jgi:hypothetical protein
MFKALIISLLLSIVVLGQTSDVLVKESKINFTNTPMSTDKVLQPMGYKLAGLYYPVMDTLSNFYFRGGITEGDTLKLRWKDSVYTYVPDSLGVDSLTAGYLPFDRISVEPLNYFWLALPDTMPAVRGTKTLKWLFRLEK